MARWAMYLALNQAHSDSFSSAMVIALVGMAATVSLVLAMCAQLRNRVQSKEVSDGEMSSAEHIRRLEDRKTRCINMSLSKMSNKRLLGAQSKGEEDHVDGKGLGVDDEEGHAVDGNPMVGEWADAVWKRSILLGERCEPPAFSGLILYDEYGNLVQDLPCRSPHRPISPSLRQLMSTT